MSRYEENTGRYIVAYGMDHAVGIFVQVFDLNRDDAETPIIDLDEVFDGLRGADLRAIARKYGAELVGDRIGQA